MSDINASQVQWNSKILDHSAFTWSVSVSNIIEKHGENISQPAAKNYYDTSRNYESFLSDKDVCMPVRATTDRIESALQNPSDVNKFTPLLQILSITKWTYISQNAAALTVTKKRNLFISRIGAKTYNINGILSAKQTSFVLHVAPRRNVNLGTPLMLNARNFTKWIGKQSVLTS